MHEKGDRRPWDMGGGSVRAGRGAARSWERQRRTGTGLAVTALAVLGTLLVIREHRQGADVAPGTADKAAPGAADAGVGCCVHAINPAGGEENRQVPVPLLLPGVVGWRSHHGAPVATAGRVCVCV